MDDDSWSNLMSFIKNDPKDFKVILNGNTFNSYEKFQQYLEDIIEIKNDFYQMKIKVNNYYEIPVFREKSKLIAYIHFKLKISDKLLQS